MSGSGFSAVVRFEVVRTFKKPQFWLAAILMPILFGIISLAVAWSSNTSAVASSSEPIRFEYVAPHGVISEPVAAAHHGSERSDAAGAIERVKGGTLDALFVYDGRSPSYDVTIYAQDRGVFRNGAYQKLARTVFDESVDARVGSPDVVREIRAGVATHVVPFADGKPAMGIGAMLPPALLVLVLVLVVALLGNQILTATVEEKENRIAEILLVSITARTLIQAKITALAVIGVTQVCVIALPSLAMLAASDLGEPFAGLELGPLIYDPARMVFGMMILVSGLVLMTSALVTIGAVMPSAKDAAPSCTVVIMATIAPLYLVTSLIVDPTSPVAYVMTYIPFFAAATALLRNAAGGLAWWEAVLVATELFGFGALLLRFAISIFQRGVIQYGARLPLGKVLRPRARLRA